VRFEFIRAEKGVFSIALMCEVLGVSRSGFYAWARRPKAKRDIDDERLSVHVVAAHHASRGTYGSPRVHAELRAQGHQIGRKRVERLMRENRLKARTKRRFRATTDSKHGLPVAPNLLGRDFNTRAPDVVWVTDITYIWTAEGWLYLAAILDLYSRRVVGWAMSEQLTRQLALDALDMALVHRRPSAGLVHHSDRGCQYASHDYQRELGRRGLICSMSRKGDCWDNAVAESFFATLKVELVYRTEFATRTSARTAVFDYIETFYNRRRRHSSLGYVSPIDFENQATHPAAFAA
jgi:transposase InsO family protein